MQVRWLDTSVMEGCVNIPFILRCTSTESTISRQDARHHQLVPHEVPDLCASFALNITGIIASRTDSDFGSCANLIHHLVGDDWLLTHLRKLRQKTVVE